MALRHFANAPATTLAASCSSSATSITVTSTTGLPISYPYTLILDQATSSEEVVTVTGGAGTTLTVTRGADSTTAFAHAASASVVHGISAQDPREANAHVNATGAVHGVAGTIVGTSDTQTVSNKTLGNSNVINGFTASRFMEADGSGRLASGSKVIPAGVVVGDTDTQTLTNKTLTSPTINTPTIATPTVTSLTLDGTNVSVMTAYTPVLTNWVLGNGTLTGSYVKIGKLVVGGFQLTLGTTTNTATGNPVFGLPFAPATGVGAPLGTSSLLDVSGGNRQHWQLFQVGASTCQVTSENDARVFGSSPWTWTNPDVIWGNFTFWVA